MIALIDYDSGNLRSAQKALLKVGADVRVVRRPEELKEAAGVVLPGVGAFDDCVNAMQKQELLGAIREYIQSGRPFLGICVGYQALFETQRRIQQLRGGPRRFRGKSGAIPGPARPQGPANWLEPAQHPQAGLSDLSGHSSGQLCVFCPQLFSPTRGRRDHCDRNDLWRALRLVGLARECLCDAISPGKKPGDGLALAEKLRGAGALNAAACVRADLCYFCRVVGRCTGRNKIEN